MFDVSSFESLGETYARFGERGGMERLSLGGEGLLGTHRCDTCDERMRRREEMGGGIWD